MFALRQYLLLLLTAMLWGGGFVGQKLGMDYVSPFTFNFFRTLIGALFPAAGDHDRLQDQNKGRERNKEKQQI